MSVTLVEVVNRSRAALDEGAVAAFVGAVVAAEGAAGAELGVRFVGERAMRALNRDHRGLDETTDVLSFPLEEAGEWGAAEGGGEAGAERAKVTGAVDGAEAGAAGARPPRLLGDIVVCPRVALRQARVAQLPPAQELATLIVHGVLHLLGYDHERDAGEMMRRQGELLADLRWEALYASSR